MLMALALLCLASTTFTGCHHNLIGKCARPGKPELTALDPGQFVCSPDNMAVIMLNANAMRLAVEQRDNALDCYEAQAR